MKKSKYDLESLERLSKLLPYPANSMYDAEERMADEEYDGKKKVRTRTIIVGILLAIAAFLCFYLWAMPSGLILFGVILVGCVMIGFVVHCILTMAQSRSECADYAKTKDYLKTYKGKATQSRGERPDRRFLDYCARVVGRLTTRRVWVRNALIVFLVLVIALLLVWGRPATETPGPAPTVNVTLDPNVSDPVNPDKQGEIDELNKKLEEGFVTISINKSPVFSSGSAAGNLNIANLEENNYPQVVELYMMDGDGNATDQRIYQSGLIPVGKTVATAKLDVDLDMGVYRVMAVVHAVNGETSEILGTIRTPLTLTVQS